MILLLSIVKPVRSTDRPSCLFISLEQFVSKLALCGIEDAAQCFESSHTVVHTPREVVEYNATKCSVILALLRFVTVLLTSHPNEAFSVCFTATCIHELINERQLTWLQTIMYHTDLDVKMKVTQCAGCISANTRLHQLCC